MDLSMAQFEFGSAIEGFRLIPKFKDGGKPEEYQQFIIAHLIALWLTRLRRVFSCRLWIHQAQSLLSSLE